MLRKINHPEVRETIDKTALRSWLSPGPGSTCTCSPLGSQTRPPLRVIKAGILRPREIALLLFMASNIVLTVKAKSVGRRQIDTSLHWYSCRKRFRFKRKQLGAFWRKQNLVVGCWLDSVVYMEIWVDAIVFRVQIFWRELAMNASEVLINTFWLVYNWFWNSFQTFLSKAWLNNLLTDIYYKIIYWSARSECSSCRIRKTFWKPSTWQTFVYNSILKGLRNLNCTMGDFLWPWLGRLQCMYMAPCSLTLPTGSAFKIHPATFETKTKVHQKSCSYSVRDHAFYRASGG